ncbi:MAG: methyltransferase type 12 [Sphingomonas bacterium]|uniref:methyltransferase domain-containing protein n=1 Tax=Sphingomonas bacterium TaxID=1895847 RepID=UPI00263913A8|nr:methyltransferase domain-containing protein [Sphingomonas bacterium]MDB5696198.1 methyltransferase type 12 [Sphingomonas bacterium]
MKRAVDAHELMDADDLDPEVYAAVVGDLAKVNVVTMAARPTLAFLNKIVSDDEVPHIKLLDVGFGNGDLLRRIARWAARRGITTELVGVDLNPRSELAARAHTPADLHIRYVTGDYRDVGGDWDAVISSLVAHHMTHDQLVAFIRWMHANARDWFVNDLHRHGFAYRGYPLLAGLARWHPIVRHDGRLSIARSYRPAEWPPILKEAGVRGARVFRAFPFRLCVEFLR